MGDKNVKIWVHFSFKKSKILIKMSVAQPPGGQGGAEYSLTAKILPKILKKREKSGEMRGKIGKKRKKSGRFFTLPLLTDRAGYATEICVTLRSQFFYKRLEKGCGLPTMAKKIETGLLQWQTVKKEAWVTVNHSKIKEINCSDLYECIMPTDSSHMASAHLTEFRQ